MTMMLPGLGGAGAPPEAPPITPPISAPTPSLADMAKRLDDLESRITALEEGSGASEGEIPLLPDMGGGISPPTVA